MRPVTLSGAEIRARVQLTDPVSMLPWDVDEKIRLHSAGELPAPFLLQDDSTFLVINGNHRTVIAECMGWTMNFSVAETDEDIRTIQEHKDDSRLGLPAKIDDALNELRKAAQEHNVQWDYFHGPPDW